MVVRGCENKMNEKVKEGETNRDVVETCRKKNSMHALIAFKP